MYIAIYVYIYMYIYVFYFLIYIIFYICIYIVTRKDAMRMFEDLGAEASKVSLLIHFGKMKILSSRLGQ